MARETERIRGIYERMAPRYDSQLDRVEGFFFHEGRVALVAQARGDVLEIGVGTGRNLALYPAEARVTAIDLSPAMLERARSRAAELGRQVELRVSDAEALEFPDGSFDTVVSTLVLCTIPDPARGVREVRRVLRPGGRYLVLDHVRSPQPLVRFVQMLLDPILVRTEGDHLTREPVEYLTAAGFRIDELVRSRWGIVERVVATAP
ncbi:MAG TPA: class I SAM-dependent methyltransferase [Candidatus Limnocylindria bacterium]|nr:class I SAM-dependent methyltransferase [Candidatus Limnocylindria bacterium]